MPPPQIFDCVFKLSVSRSVRGLRVDGKTWTMNRKPTSQKRGSCTHYNASVREVSVTSQERFCVYFFGYCRLVPPLQRLRPIFTGGRKLVREEETGVNVSAPELKRVCYYAPNDAGDVRPSELDPWLCTHIIYGFAVVRNSTLVPADPSHVARYVELTTLKHVNSNLRVLLSVGGGGGNDGFSEMVDSPKTRRAFLNSAIELLQNCNFDGLDVDWEYPLKRDRRNFVQLLKEARYLFEKHSSEKQRGFLLSVAVAATRAIVDASYDAAAMAKYVDFVNLMSYDYHVYAPYLPFTGHNSPLFSRKAEEGYFSTLNTAWSAEYWVSLGMPRNKIMVGIPIYARTFRLLSADRHGFDAPIVGVGPNGGSVDFPWVCEFLRNGSTSVFDDESQVPYAFKNLTWVAYDTFRSIRSKVVWVKAREFAGIMTFDLHCDDAMGLCGQGKFPLHGMIYNMLT